MVHVGIVPRCVEKSAVGEHVPSSRASFQPWTPELYKTLLRYSGQEQLCVFEAETLGRTPGNTPYGTMVDFI